MHKICDIVHKISDIVHKICDIVHTICHIVDKICHIVCKICHIVLICLFPAHETASSANTLMSLEYFSRDISLSLTRNRRILEVLQI